LKAYNNVDGQQSSERLPRLDGNRRDFRPVELITKVEKTAESKLIEISLEV